MTYLIAMILLWRFLATKTAGRCRTVGTLRVLFGVKCVVTLLRARLRIWSTDTDFLSLLPFKSFDITKPNRFHLRPLGF